MTGPSYSVVARTTRLSIDATTYPHAERVAHQLACHWAQCAPGSWGSASGGRSYHTALRDLLDYLNRLEAPPSDLVYLDAIILDGWVDDMRARLGRESVRNRASCMRALFDNFDATQLHRSLTDGVVLRWRPDVERGGAPLSDLTPGQWAALRKLTKRSVMETTRRIRAGHALAKTGHDPGDDLAAWRLEENIYWAVLHDRTDLERLGEAIDQHGWPGWLGPRYATTLRGRAAARFVLRQVRQQLLPGLLDMAAFWTAMAIATGLPPESVNDLECHWFDTGADAELTLLRYRKQRRGAPTVPLVLPARPQFSAQRLRDLYLELSAPLRKRQDPESRDRLWLFVSFPKGQDMRMRVADDSTRHFANWLRAVGLLDPTYVRRIQETRDARLATGSREVAPRRARHHLPASLESWSGRVDARRIRKTEKARRLVASGLWSAAADHTVRVLIAHYTNSELVRVQAALVITEVAETLTAFAAGPRPATVVTAKAQTEASRHVAARDRLSAALGVTGEQLDAILAGRHSIGAVSCIDPLASPYEEPGRFCRQAGTSLCLTCPQAVVTARHVPDLWAEVERLDRIAATVTGDAFGAMHGDYHRALLDALAAFDAPGVEGYRTRGVIPVHGPAGAVPARLQRRRARR